MNAANSDGTHEVEGTTELENALITVELKLDETFEAAGRQALADDEAGAGLVLEQVLDLIYDTFGAVIPYDRIGVATVEDDGQIVRSRWARSEVDSLTMGTGYAAPLEDETIQAILGAGEPLIINDLEAYLEEHPESQATRDIIEEGMRATLTCPLVSGSKPTGMMVFSSVERGVYTDKHRDIFTHIAAHVAAILERTRMYEKLIELNWQLRVASDALKYQATHDSLTRLWNRNAMLDIVERERDRARRQEKAITLVMCDIDKFKDVNDTHGHATGDVVLQVVANRLAAALRSYETVGRYGGEEFLITLYDCDADGAPHAMERLRAAVGDDKIETDTGPISVTISLGGAVGADAGADVDVDELIRVADEALYAAKDGGRNRHEVRVVGTGSA